MPHGSPEGVQHPASKGGELSASNTSQGAATTEVGSHLLQSAISNSSSRTGNSGKICSTHARTLASHQTRTDKGCRTDLGCFAGFLGMLSGLSLLYIYIFVCCRATNNQPNNQTNKQPNKKPTKQHQTTNQPNKQTHCCTSCVRFPTTLTGQVAAEGRGATLIGEAPSCAQQRSWGCSKALPKPMRSHMDSGL